MRMHHLVEPPLAASLHTAETFLTHFLGHVRINPAGVIVGNVYQRVTLVPPREVLVNT